MPKILVTANQQLIRAGLISILTGQFGDSMFIRETDADSSILVCREFQPAVILLDIDISLGCGLELTARLVDCPSRPKVIVIPGKSEPNLLNLLLETHAAGYLTKNSSEADLVAAVKAVMNGTSYVNEEFSRWVALAKVEGRESVPLSSLSRREMEVMLALAEGRSPEEIAKSLWISPKTVATYKQRIHEKLNTKNTADITRIAVRSGLLTSV